MTRATRTLWPDGLRRPWIRLAVAMVAAPLALGGVLVLAAFLVYLASEPDAGEAAGRTGAAAVWLVGYLLGFTLTVGLAGVAILWVSAERGVLAWLATGAGAGAIGAVGIGMIAGGVAPLQIAIAAAFGLALFALIRWFAGIRAG